ncbi:GNAT family N-acetyltransferase [Janibacter anophelis]|uniref:GNAT family N-acetyltransferase n=1 Tax=Janibacter anophelis TaxID=319054 RepID=UPI001FD05FAC|nr:GNAT family N-acetyltransferase [Janibacter anophelis]
MRDHRLTSCNYGIVGNETSAIDVQREVVLRTPRLILTSWLVDDVQSLHEVHSDPETMEFVRHGRPESRREVELLVDQYMAEHAARGWTKWRLADLDGQLVGRAGFGGTPEIRGMSYLIRRSRWGLGLATEIAEALVGWHLSHTIAVPLRAIVAVGNDASARVLEKVGFDEAGQEDFDGTPCRAFTHPDTD